MLAAKLIREWTREYTKILNSLPEKITDQAVKILNENLDKVLGKDFGSSERIKKFFHDYIEKTYKNSKREFAPQANLSLPDKKAVDVLTKHNCFWIGEHYGKHVGGKISEITQQAIFDGLGRKELAKELKSALGGEVGGYKYWDVASSAALVRARSFGAISGMEEAGIAEYEILAMQDERMCPICGEMDGRAFSVAVTRERINSVLNIKDPEAFKSAMPWQTESPKGLSNEALQNSGMNLPPFHGRCRCTLVMVSESFNEVTPPLSIEDEIVARLESLKQQNAKYESDYNELKLKIHDAVMSKNYDLYNQLAAEQKKLLEDWIKLDLDNSIRRIKIEAADKGVIFTSGIAKNLDKTDVDIIREAVKSAPKNIRRIWNMYENEMNIIETNSKNSYYKPSKRGIYINISEDKNNSYNIPQYRTIFHELGHLIDNASGRNFMYYISQTSKYDLYNTLKSEVNSYVNSTLIKLKRDAVASGKSAANIKKSDAYLKIQHELCKTPVRLTSGVSDVFNGATLGKIKNTWIHPSKYWKDDPEKVTLEFFAETFSSSIVNPDAIELVKKYLPQSYEIFDKIIQNVAEGGI